MEKKRMRGGFTLIEMLAAILIMVFLIMGMGVGMDAGSHIYRDAMFESESATLAGILNTSLGDILRYSINIRYTSDDPTVNIPVKDQLTPEEITRLNEEFGGDIDFVFTSLDYGIQDAFFYTPVDVADGSNRGVLQMLNLRKPGAVELVNKGAYPDLLVSDFVIRYSPRKNPGIEGGYFEISYKIYNSTLEKCRDVETIVRLMND